MVLSVPMGEGEDRRSIDSAPDVSNLAQLTAKAIRGISTLSRGFNKSGRFDYRFVPSAEDAYNDVADFLEVANNFFDKRSSTDLPDVEDAVSEEGGWE